MRSAVVLLLTMVLAGPASAQAWNAFTRCEGERPSYVLRDVCSPAYLRRIERAFGVRPLARVASGKRAVRIVVIEGREYNNGVGQFTINDRRDRAC